MSVSADEQSTVGTEAATRTPEPPPSPHAPSTSHSSMTVGSPLEALERDEMARTRRFCFIGITIAIVAALFVPLLPGNQTAALLVLAAVGLVVGLARPRLDAVLYATLFAVVTVIQMAFIASPRRSLILVPELSALAGLGLTWTLARLGLGRSAPE